MEVEAVGHNASDSMCHPMKMVIARLCKCYWPALHIKHNLIGRKRL